MAKAKQRAATTTTIRRAGHRAAHTTAPRRARRPVVARLTPRISVVIPAYNEQSRLGETLAAAVSHLERFDKAWEIIVSDDGSRDGTADLVRTRARTQQAIRLVRTETNLGKGSAVRRGVLAARGERVLVMDADLATPMDQLDRLLAPLDSAQSEIAVGSRGVRGSRVSGRTVGRRLMSAALSLFRRSLVLPSIRDTQCGFKLFDSAAARHIFANSQVPGFAFDVEILQRARQLGYRITEVGVTWNDRAGSTVHPVRDSLRVLRDVLLLRARSFRAARHVATVPAAEQRGTAILTVDRPASVADAAAPALQLRASDRVLHADEETVVVAGFGLTEVEAIGFRQRLERLPVSSASLEVTEARVSGALPLSTLLAAGSRAVHPAATGHATAGDAVDDHAHRLLTWARRRRTLRILIALNVVGAAWWLSWLLVPSHAANGPLYTALVLAEAFNIAQVFGYWYTVWHSKRPQTCTADVAGEVDVYITAYNEDLGIIADTVRAAVQMRHPHRTWLLDDGHRPEARALALSLGAEYLSRDGNAGAKAGNINHALAHTTGDFIAVLDVDHRPRPEFLERLLPWMSDPKVALVQAPQYYANRATNAVTSAAMDQQEIFFGPICDGKAGLGATFCCGTNMLLRREALTSVGGFREDSITEDAATSLDIHEKGWQSRYVNERLADGLAPEDMGAYLSQQSRWARGNLQMLFRKRVMRRRMPLKLRLQYAWSAAHYLSGVPTVVYLSLPLLFLLFGVQTVSPSSPEFIGHFLPYILTTIFILARSAEGRLRFRAIQFSYGLFPLYIASTVSVLTGRRARFTVTPKVGRQQSFYHLVLPQIAVLAISAAAIGVGLLHFSGERTITNACWAAFNIVLISGVVLAARPQPATVRAAAVAPLVVRPTVRAALGAVTAEARWRRRARVAPPLALAGGIAAIALLIVGAAGAASRPGSVTAGLAPAIDGAAHRAPMRSLSSPPPPAPRPARPAVFGRPPVAPSLAPAPSPPAPVVAPSPVPASAPSPSPVPTPVPPPLPSPSPVPTPVPPPLPSPSPEPAVSIPPVG